MSTLQPSFELTELLRELAQEIVAFVPKILIAIVVLAIAFVIIRFLSAVLRKFFGMVGLDKMFMEMAGFTLPFSLSNAIIVLINVGIFLVAVFGISALFLAPEHMLVVREGLLYALRILSIVVVTVVILMMLSAVIERVRIETRMRGYAFFVIFLIVTTMLIDITVLSEAAKGLLSGAYRSASESR